MTGEKYLKEDAQQDVRDFRYNPHVKETQPFAGKAAIAT